MSQLPAATSAGAPLLRLTGVGHSYGAEPVLEGVDMTVARGQFTGLVGPSGSGKTTLLKLLVGTLHASTGLVERTRDLRVGYVPQVDSVDWHFPVTVRAVILMARRGRTFAPWASRDEHARVEDVLERLGLGGLGDRHIRELSGGQQQRVFVARALVREPDLLLLDEPTSGVDVRTRHEVMHLLGDLHASGHTIVLTTHDLNGIAAHLPHIVCLNKTIIGQGTPQQVLTPAVLEQTYGAPLEVLYHGGMPVVVDAPPNADRHASDLAPIAGRGAQAPR